MARKKKKASTSEKHLCEFCGKEYQSKGNLTRHRKKCPEKPVESPLQPDKIVSLHHPDVTVNRIIPPKIPKNKQKRRGPDFLLAGN